MIAKTNSKDRVMFYITQEENIEIKKALYKKGLTVKDICREENISFTTFSTVLNGQRGAGRKSLFVIKKYTGIELK